MGNHFRTSGDEPSAFTPSAPSNAGTDDFAAVPDTQQPSPLQSDLFSTDAPATQAAPSPIVNIPSPADPASPLASIPDPLAAPSPAPDVFMTSAGPAVPSTDVDEARQVRDLDAALQNPDFTSVFAPADLDRAQSRKKMAARPVSSPSSCASISPRCIPPSPTSRRSMT